MLTFSFTYLFYIVVFLYLILLYLPFTCHLILLADTEITCLFSTPPTQPHHWDTRFFRTLSIEALQLLQISENFNCNRTKVMLYKLSNLTLDQLKTFIEGLSPRGSMEVQNICMSFCEKRHADVKVLQQIFDSKKLPAAVLHSHRQLYIRLCRL
jgi:hypothetical protein